MTYKQLDKFMDKLQDYTYSCTCGHRVVIGGVKTRLFVTGVVNMFIEIKNKNLRRD